MARWSSVGSVARVAMFDGSCEVGLVVQYSTHIGFREYVC